MGFTLVRKDGPRHSDIGHGLHLFDHAHEPIWGVEINMVGADVNEILRLGELYSLIGAPGKLMLVFVVAVNNRRIYNVVLYGVVYDDDFKIPLGPADMVEGFEKLIFVLKRNETGCD